MSEAETRTTKWDEVLEEQAQVDSAVADLERHVERFVAGEEGLHEKIHKDTEKLIELFIEHFANEEAEDGLFADLVASEPRLVHAVEKLKADHRHFLGDMYEIQAGLRGERDADLGGLARFVLDLIDRLKKHESKEMALLLEAAGANPVGGES